VRTVLFANGRVGRDAIGWLRERGTGIAGLVVHPDAAAREKDAILAAARLDPARVLEAPALRSEAGVAKLASFGGEIGLSLYFAYLLQPAVLELFPRGVVNLHPGYLPYNRGRYTNVWSIVDSTPAGVTLHYVDAGVDTGDLIERRRVPVTPYDTGLTLHRRLEDASLALLRETWPAIEAGTAPREPQDGAQATLHRAKDVEVLDRLDLDRPTTARELIDLLRARTFPPHAGAYFEVEGQRVYVRVALLREDEL